MIRTTLLTAAIGLAFLLSPAHAGGPVLITEEGPVAATHDRKIGGVVVGLLIIGALLVASGGGDVCNGQEEPAPTPGCR